MDYSAVQMMEALKKLASKCLQKNPIERPSIRAWQTEMEKLRKTLPL